MYGAAKQAVWLLLSCVAGLQTVLALSMRLCATRTVSSTLHIQHICTYQHCKAITGSTRNPTLGGAQHVVVSNHQTVSLSTKNLTLGGAAFHGVTPSWSHIIILCCCVLSSIRPSIHLVTSYMLWFHIINPPHNSLGIYHQVVHIVCYGFTSSV